jgi:hypothetical protein
MARKTPRRRAPPQVQPAAQPGQEEIVYAQTAPQATIPLLFPFRVGRVWYRSVDFLPPTFATLEELRASDHLSGPDIIAGASSVSATVVRFMRWPDVAACAEAALALYPEDFRAVFEGASQEPPAAAPPPRGPPLPINSDDPSANPSVENGFPPGDFAPVDEDPGREQDFYVDPSEL